jgi:predicted permease
METIKIVLLLIVFIWLIASYILGIIHIFDKDLDTFTDVIWAFVIWLLSPIFIIELIACTKELIEDNKQNHK